MYNIFASYYSRERESSTGWDGDVHSGTSELCIVECRHCNWFSMCCAAAEGGKDVLRAGVTGRNMKLWTHG
jgi:hypothetical protein